jgi:hypothetical protein
VIKKNKESKDKNMFDLKNKDKKLKKKTCHVITLE